MGEGGEGGRGAWEEGTREEGTWEEAREHGFVEEDGTWICRGGGHTILHRRRENGWRKWFDFFLLSLECAC